MSEWQPIETAPHNQLVLLFCPHRATSNPERIELDYASHGWTRDGASTMSYHSWATHWLPLPAPPSNFQPIADVVGRIVARVEGDGE